MPQQNTEIKLNFSDLYIKIRDEIRDANITDEKLNKNMLALLKLANTEEEKNTLYEMAINDLDVLVHYQIIASLGSINDEDTLSKQFKKLTVSYLPSVKEYVSEYSTSSERHYQLLTTIALNAIALANINAQGSKCLINDFINTLEENKTKYYEFACGRHRFDYFIIQVKYALWVLNADSESAKNFLINEHNPRLTEKEQEDARDYDANHIPYIDPYLCRYAVAALADMSLKDENKQILADELEQLTPNIRCLKLRQFILLSCNKLRNNNNDKSIYLVLNNMEYNKFGILSFSNETLSSHQLMESIIAQPQQTPEDIEVVFSHLVSWFDEVFGDDEMQTLKAIMQFDFTQCESMFSSTVFMLELLKCGIFVDAEYRTPETKALVILLINLCNDINKKLLSGSLIFIYQMHHDFDYDILDAYIANGLDLETIGRSYSKNLSVREKIREWLNKNKKKNKKQMYEIYTRLVRSKKPLNGNIDLNDSTNWFTALLSKLF